MGNGGIFESTLAENRRPKILMVEASQLKPNTIYEVFGCFWADLGSAAAFLRC